MWRQEASMASLLLFCTRPLMIAQIMATTSTLNELSMRPSDRAVTVATASSKSNSNCASTCWREGRELYPK
jgi:hypothetical protein